MRKPAAIRLAMWLSLPVLSLAACERQPAPPAAEMETAETRPDSWITTAVQARLYADDAVRGGDIDVTTENGVVMLSGTVESEQAKQQATVIAGRVEGVTRVDDRLTVQASQARTDAAERDAAATTGTVDAADATTPGWITTKIQAQYFVNPEIKPWNIDVTTRTGGVVELRGEVDAAEDKAEAVRIARNTEGVTRVEDRLRIRGEAASPDVVDNDAVDVDFDTSDAWLTTKIQSKYFLDSDVKGFDVDVTTNNGIVTLAGTVETAAEKRQAVSIARNTEGVKEVRDQLTVGPDTATATTTAAARSTARDVSARVEDGWITTKIQSMFYLDPTVKGHEIDVDTRNGVVTLKGKVESDRVKAEAEQIARETDGVTRVTSQLTVAPPQVQ